MPRLAVYYACALGSGMSETVVLNEVVISLRIAVDPEGEFDIPTEGLTGITLICDGSGVPAGREDALQWLLDEMPMVQAAAHALAATIELGIDYDSVVRWTEFIGKPAGVHMELRCMVTSRREGLRFAATLRDWADAGADD